MQQSKGFTLLEVIIALAIFSISLLAITRALGQSARSLDHVQQKTFSHWVARNATAELILGLEGKFGIGEYEGQMQMGNQTYSWHARIESSPDPYVWIIRVEAGNDTMVTYTRAAS